ncbi:hypothetical protein M7775_13430 [Sporomusa sphaeroides DSM 2875]|uniref:hypothetical protein n=1 Tax=Sporomusa sphaeroides TaxID=47679 RepID=UPI00202DC740|nr:hypothetical protein [Sporomusa sphaeroides]MCM0759554.1 hypothetical protein [Sporomusa sphaeroides DSM 2875]
MNMSSVSAGGSAGMSGSSGSQHSQMTAGKNTAATEIGSATKQLSVDPRLGKTVDISA